MNKQIAKCKQVSTGYVKKKQWKDGRMKKENGKMAKWQNEKN